MYCTSPRMQNDPEEFICVLCMRKPELCVCRTRKLCHQFEDAFPRLIVIVPIVDKCCSLRAYNQLGAYCSVLTTRDVAARIFRMFARQSPLIVFCFVFFRPSTRRSCWRDTATRTACSTVSGLGLTLMDEQTLKVYDLTSHEGVSVVPKQSDVGCALCSNNVLIIN